MWWNRWMRRTHRDNMAAGAYQHAIIRADMRSCGYTHLEAVLDSGISELAKRVPGDHHSCGTLIAHADLFGRIQGGDIVVAVKVGGTHFTSYECCHYTKCEKHTVCSFSDEILVAEIMLFSRTGNCDRMEQCALL